MKKVYYVLFNVPKESERLISIHKTKKGAINKVKSIIKDDEFDKWKHSNDWVNQWNYTFSVVEYDLED